MDTLSLQDVEPTFLRKRKLLELVLARKGTDEEVLLRTSPFSY